MNTIDKTSVQTASAFFVGRGYAVSATDEEFDNFDLVCSGDKSGTFAVEVKGRSCAVDRYPDMAVDYTKYQAALSAIDAGEYSGVLVCSIYTDGYLALGNILSGHDAFADGPASTYYARSVGRYQKHFWDVPRQKVWNLDEIN